MNELDSFTINFITNGIDKLQDQIKGIRNSLDSLNDSFEKGTSKGNTFFSNFGSWMGDLASLAAGFITIRDAINGVFNVSSKIINLNLTADSVNRTALEVETMSRALMQFSDKVDVGEMFGEAGNLYKALDTITGKAWRLQFGTDLTEELNRAGGIIFTGEESDQEMLAKIIKGLEYHRQTGTSYDKNQLAKVLGLSETAVAFLSSGQTTVDAILKKERKRAYLYSEDNLKAADELMTARRQLKEVWDKIYMELTPTITYMIEQFSVLIEQLRPIIQILTDVLTWAMEKYNWLLEKTTGWAKKAGESLSQSLTYSDRYSAFSTLSKMIDSDNWQNADFGEINRLFGKAKIYVSEFADTEKNRKMLDLVEERMKVLAESRWGNLNNNSKTISNSGNLVIENINVKDAKEVGEAVESIKQRQQTPAGINAAWNGEMNL